MHFGFVKSVIKMSFLGGIGNYDSNRFRRMTMWGYVGGCMLWVGIHLGGLTEGLGCVWKMQMSSSKT